MLSRTVRKWRRIHEWSSLICTAFLLLLCVTGLPLVFHDEIDQWLGYTLDAPKMPDATPRISVDRVAEIALEKAPGKTIQFIVPDDDEPIWHVRLGDTAAAREAKAIVSIDARSGAVLRSVTKDSGSGPFITFVLQLHTDLFSGQNGSFFLCFIGFMFVTSIVSGAIVYAPFMRRLDFGEIRVEKGPRARWLDLHNLLGIAITVWLLVVGATGMINTLLTQIARHWQRTELTDMIAKWKDKARPAHIIPPQQALDVARAALPHMKLSSIAVPGNAFAGNHHYDVFMKGDSPLTSRLLQPVLVDAETGQFTDTRQLPWYAKALFLSQPLHFGDYGGLPLKIIWALLDAICIVVLISGLYLWVARRRSAKTSSKRQSAPLMKVTAS